MELVWSDEFNKEGPPDTSNWSYEKGFVRNKELQWYQQDNARCSSGCLIITAKKDTIKNSKYNPQSTNWKLNRQYAYYSSACLKTRNKQQWKYGSLLVRARITVSKGSWPAIWLLGISKPWPSCGEIDVMEFYRVKDVPHILANFAWGTKQQWVAKWDGAKKPLKEFVNQNPQWAKQFHLWRLDWSERSMKISLDGEMLNDVALDTTLNPDGFNPFKQAHYLLLNLAIGANGGNPAQSPFPMTYEVDYARVYQPYNGQRNSYTTRHSTGSLINGYSIKYFLNSSKLSFPIIKGNEKRELHFTLHSLDGSILMKQTIATPSNAGFYQVTVPSSISMGLYIITLK